MKVDQMHSSNYKGIPAMSPPEVHTYLEEIGREWSGKGVAMEIGCWHGATSAALLKGLTKAGYDKSFWAFDQWRANESEVMKAAEQGVHIHLHENLAPIYRHNVTPFYSDVIQVKGHVPGQLHIFSGEPVEICLFDAPKRNPIFEDCIQFVLPLLIPGVSVLGLMDYYFYRSRRDVQQKKDWEQFLAPVKFIETYSEHFTMMREFPTNGSCVFFKYEKQIS